MSGLGQPTSSDTSVPSHTALESPARKSGDGDGSENTYHPLQEVDHLPHHGHTSHKRHDHAHKKLDIRFFDPRGIERLCRTLAARTRRSSSDSREKFVVDKSFDLAKSLRDFMDKAEKRDGGKRRELGVMFDRLRVIGAGASANFQPTFGSVLSPLRLVEKIHKLRHPAVRDILNGFYGVVRPGEMLLVLGRPDAGCSTLLRVLANQRSEYYGVEGDVFYDSFTPAQIKHHYKGDVQYSPEDDVHFPTMTVEQTLRFAAKTRTPSHRIDDLTRAEAHRIIVEIVLTVLGLRQARNTLIGSASIQGISGGEKKRVSIGEALVTRSLLTSWDNSTRGLDSSTALEFIRALRIATDLMRMTTIVSLYQASESLYQLFDKVCVIHEGKMVYFGPTDRARQYFIDLGFETAPRETTPDFLVSVTDPNARLIRPGFESRTPRTALELSQCYDKSEISQLNREDMESYRREFVGNEDLVAAFKARAVSDHAKTALPKSSYITSIPMQTRALMIRRFQIVKGGILAQGIQTSIFILQAIIMGTIFLNSPNSTSAFFSRGGVIFFAVLFAALTSQAEIPSLFAQRPIILRQARAAMYHPCIEYLSYTLVDIPITVITLMLFCIILYFLVKLQQSAGQFFIFFLFVFTMTITMRAWFRALAAIFKSPAPAQTTAGLAMLLLVLYTGYTIPQPSMIGALRWITYINPLKYGFEAMMVNEFHTINAQCATLVPSGPGYDELPLQNKVCTTVGSLPGQATVDGIRYLSLAFNYSFSHLWRNFGIVCAFFIGFLTLYLTATEINTGSASDSSAVLYKRTLQAMLGKSAPASQKKGDEEKQASTPVPPADASSTEEKALAGTPTMTDIFSWQHIEYTIPVSGGQHKRLLDDISGYVAPGKLTALMGATGAGKTTLLNVLAQRTYIGVISGDRFVNGHAPPLDFQAQTGYCQQLDTHVPTMTVRESLRFSAKLRQPRSVPDSEKEAYVEKCLEMCGLSDLGDAVVGSLNIEYRKRTTIAVELAAKPRLLLFLDEPTSGLDSQTAWSIMTFLRSLADNGLSILCTIHQPSAVLFQLFDRLLLLQDGGQTVYFGDIGDNSSQMISYFERNGAHKCKPDENPAEYMLTVIGAGAGARASATVDWHEIWQKSPEAGMLVEELDRIHAEGRSRPPVEAALHKEFATPWLYQMMFLLKRDSYAHWRNPTYLMSKVALNITSALFIGFTFFKSKDSIQGTQNKLFAIFMSTIVTVALALQLQIPYIAMRDVYEIRERPSRMYSWTALVTAQILAEIPWNVVGSSLFYFCWYWTVGFPSDRAGYTYLIFCIVNPLYYTTIGQAIAAMSRTPEISALLFSFFFAFIIAFNGVMQPFRALGWWKWMYRVSPYTYLIEGIYGQAVGRQPIHCSPIEYVQIDPPSNLTCYQYMQPFIDAAGGYIANPNATVGCNFCAYATTDEFLQQNFNIFYSHRWRNVGLMCVYIGFNVVAVYVCTYIFRIRFFNPFAWIGWLRRRLARPRRPTSQEKHTDS